MPKKPGAKDTRKKISIDDAVISMFSAVWDNRVHGQVCCINEHDPAKPNRVDESTGSVGLIDSESEWREYEAATVEERKILKMRWPSNVGWACTDCVNRILERE